MLFTRAVVLLATLASTLVSAAPPVVAPSKAAAICDQPTLSAMSNQWSTAAYITTNTDKPLRKAGIFWSGTINGASVRTNAETCGAKTNPNGYTVGMMMCDHGGFVMPSTSDAAATALWDTASRVFAQNAVGKAFLVIGTSFNPQGTWFRVELPALQANNAVTSVLQLNPTTCASTCYWICRKATDCTGLPKCAGAP